SRSEKADMSVHRPERRVLMHGETPLTRPSRTAAELDIDLWLKRDDLTGLAESGNKLRKLEYLVAEAIAQNADTLVTVGGVNSNHARATAVVAARLGLKSHLLLRGEDRHPPTGNLLIDKMLGAGLTFINARQWADRYDIMNDVADDLRRQGRRPYLIPEGGSNALGTLGYMAMIPELLRQIDAVGEPLRRIVHATGSGGTTAGLALGLADADRSDVDVLGVAVCNDAPYFDHRIQTIADEIEARGWIDASTRASARWTIVEGYKGKGYGRTTAREMAEHAALARADGIFVDPVYSGKAFCALRDMAASQRWTDGVTVFLHTGGLFELFAFGHEIQALD
ncbi:MAG: D-cysteine desulfhydrase family protein, partial [Myxococcota bacterium]